MRPSALTLAPGQRVFLGTAYEVADPATGLAWNAGGGTLQVEPSTGSAIYTAPLEPGTYGVTVSGVLHPELSASAVITVQEAAPSSFRVSPASATLRTGHSMLLEATDAQGRILSRVRWAVQEANGGIVTPAGQYRAPLTAGTYHVVVASLDDPSLTATAALAVVAGGGGGSGGGGGETYTPMSFGLTVTPDKAEIPAGTYQALSALVEGLDDQGVTWEIVGAPESAAVDEQGTFKASLPGAYQVQATSKADTQLWGTAVITVVSSVKPIEGAPVASSLKGYSVTALKDGRILIAGGFDGVNSLASARIYDPETKTFTELPPMFVSRYNHLATLLEDGRVLISGGVCYPCQDVKEKQGWWLDEYNRIYLSELFNPNTNRFEPLPPNTSNAVSFDDIPGGWVRHPHSPQGSAIRLGNGQVLQVSGAYVTSTNVEEFTNPRLSDVFTPGPDTFDVSNFNNAPVGWDWWLRTENCFPTRADSKAVTLADGSALLTGGFIPPRWAGGGTSDLIEGSILNEAWRYVPGTGIQRLADMVQGRASHTATLLPDGKVLIVGGANGLDYSLADPKELGDPRTVYISTPTAELYDPATGQFTATGSLKDTRSGHAAILLPTGKVLVAGGKRQNLDGTWTYPKTMELYDPETGKFEVMETLEYGLEDPKLALLPDGNPFLMGVARANSALASATARQGFAPFSLGQMQSQANGTTLTVSINVDPFLLVKAQFGKYQFSPAVRGFDYSRLAALTLASPHTQVQILAPDGRTLREEYTNQNGIARFKLIEHPGDRSMLVDPAYRDAKIRIRAKWKLGDSELVNAGAVYDQGKNPDGSLVDPLDEGKIHFAEVPLKPSEGDPSRILTLRTVVAKSGPSDRVGGAFNVAWMFVEATKTLRGADPAFSLPKVATNWAPVLLNGPAVGSGSSAFFPSYWNPNRIYVDGARGTGGNADEFDDAVLGHEFGHFVQRLYSMDRSPGGTHLWFKQSYDVALAFSEGYGHFFQALVRMQGPDIPQTLRDPIFQNSWGDGKFSNSARINPNQISYPAPTSAGPWNEAAVFRFMWLVHMDPALFSGDVGKSIQSVKNLGTADLPSFHSWLQGVRGMVTATGNQRLTDLLAQEGFSGTPDPLYEAPVALLENTPSTNFVIKVFNDGLSEGARYGGTGYFTFTPPTDGTYEIEFRQTSGVTFNYGAYSWSAYEIGVPGDLPGLQFKSQTLSPSAIVTYSLPLMAGHRYLLRLVAKEGSVPANSSTPPVIGFTATIRR